MISDVPKGDGKSWENDARRIFLRDNKQNNYYYYRLIAGHIQRLGFFISQVFITQDKKKYYYRFEDKHTISMVNFDDNLYYIY
jgi:hypothetical protein